MFSDKGIELFNVIVVIFVVMVVTYARDDGTHFDRLVMVGL